MTTWAEFEQTAPEIASFGKTRMGSGQVGYLATSRKDGGPRVHPVTPIIGGGHLYIYMEPTSPKGHDLRRDDRYALHCAVEDQSGGGGEFWMHGRAVQITDPQTRAAWDALASYTPKERYILFELLIDRAQATTYPDGGAPIHQRWSNEKA